MEDKVTQFNIVHTDDEYEIPEECEAAEEAAEELAETNLEEHYSFINLLSLAVIMLFACVFFIAVSGSDIVQDNNLSLSFKTFFSGDYTQGLEDSYNNGIPFPDAMKAIEERISLVYGIGNKVTDPIRETPADTDTDHNSFDQPTNDNNDDPDENIITVTSKTKDGEIVTVTKKDDKKKTTTTTAIDRPEETESTTTTTTSATTTNNDKPYYTVTETEIINQPGPTTTTTTTTTTATETEPVTEPVTEPTEPPQTTEQTAEPANE